jgi:hypothetical protein
MMKRHDSSRLVPISMIGFVIALSVTIAGCLATPPSGTEFQKQTTPSSSSKTTSTTQTVTPTPAGKVAGYEIYENKDPFKQLVGANAQSQTLTTTTTDSSGTVVASSTATARLDSISNNTATITVNGTPHANLTAGSTFADSFKLISIGTGSAVIQYGDNQYTLYLGETINVK